MIRAQPLRLLPVLLLAACAVRGQLPERSAVHPAPVLSAIDDPDAAAPPAAAVLEARGQPLAAGLPATVRREVPLRAQPLSTATVLRALGTGTPVRVLGDLDNASGRWLSVLVGDTVGWLPADLVELTR